MLKILYYVMLFSSIINPLVFMPWLPQRWYLVFAGITFVLFLAQRTMSGRPLNKLPQSKYVYLLIVVFVLSVAQTGWLGGTVDTIINWSKTLIVFILLVNVAESPRDLRRSVLVVVAAVAVCSWEAWRIYWYTPELLSMERMISVGDYDQPNSFALALTVGTALTFTVLETAPGFIRKVPMLFLLGVFAVTSVYTKSRGGNLGLALVLLTSVSFSSVIRSRFLRGLLVATVIAGATVSVPIIMARDDVAGYLGGDSSAQNRIDAWVAGTHMIRARPLLGVGLGAFRENARRDYDAGSAHNTLLAVTAETGIPGGVLFVTVIVTSLKLLWRVWRQTMHDPRREDLARLSRGILIALVAFLVDTTFSVKYADPLLWTLLGLAGNVAVVQKALSADSATGTGEAGAPEEAAAAMRAAPVPRSPIQTPRPDSRP
jgi:O-antigen ligase